jgi:acyl carrier protein
MSGKLKSVFAAVFDCDITAIDSSFTSDTVTDWDSIRHMTLIAAIEDEFDFSMADDDMIDCTGYERAMEIVSNYIPSGK